MTAKIDGTHGVLQAYDYQVLTTGFSYTFAAGTQLLLAVPAGTLATGTVTMPSTPADGMNVTITSTQQITALTVNANTGQSIVGGGAIQLPAAGSRTFVYRLANTTWYSQAGVVAPAPIDIQTFNAGDADLTWDKPTDGQTMCRIQVWGGGGGGARQSAAGSAGGGGGGGYNEVTIPISYINTQTVTVGAAGVGRTASTGVGTAGGNSSVVLATAWNGRTTIAAYGGGGGSGSSKGGSGGGMLSAGTTGTATILSGGGPVLSTYSYDPCTGGAPTMGGVYYSTGIGGIWHGGGGSINPYPSGGSIYGGGGGSNNATVSGKSLYGGDGGANSAGATPAGGGGSSPTANVNGFDGGAGRVIITSW
jgi:hypothetical protein